VVLLAAALAGCGGGSDDSSSAARTDAPASEAPKPSSSPQPRESHFEGGEEDVEEFGSEAAGADRDAVLAGQRGYLSAIARSDYEAACARLSKGVKESLEALVRSDRDVPCEEILSSFLPRPAARVAASQARGEVVRVRFEGRRAIVIFHAPGARLWGLTMRREDGAWRATALNAAILAPSAATLGE
jgi:hypothetical protein